MFIPSGWWHSVINLEHTVAVTQNYVSECNLKKVHTFLKTKQVCNSSLGTYNPASEPLRKIYLSLKAT